jgi:glutamyl-tRNA synthetase
MVRTRFAPSPTGYMHLGNVWVALLNWLYAREHNGQMVLRMEDIDRARCHEEYADALMEDLEWLGLTWDEGPGGTYAYGSAVQTERMDYYRSILDSWVREDRVYPCYCTRARLHSIASAPNLGEERPVYDGHCRYMTEEERKKQTKKPSLRIKVEGPVQISFDDMFHGHQEHCLRSGADDFVVRRADGLMAYQLACAADDAAMGITHVIRGCDLLSSTPIQIYLIRLMGKTVPSYGHVPLLCDSDGIRLSKRQHGITVRELKEKGWTAGDIIGQLLYWGGALEQPEPMTAEDTARTVKIEDFRFLSKENVTVL